MKKIVKKTAVILATFLLVASCNNSPKAKENELEEAKEDVIDAKEELDESRADSISDYKTYKESIELKLNENQKRIEEVEQASKNATASTKEALKKDLANLKERNLNLRNKLANYEQGPAEKWELFKIELNNEMDDLGKSISETANKNKKK